eukprot:42660-Eustigmatos_ZCMA.PRE.1
MAAYRYAAQTHGLTYRCEDMGAWVSVSTDCLKAGRKHAYMHHPPSCHSTHRLLIRPSAVHEVTQQHIARKRRGRPCH